MPVKTISPQQLAEKLGLPEERRPVLLDVRNPEEHAYVHLLVPLDELAEREDELESLAWREVVVYCHHGSRSLDGAAFLEARGIDAASLAGGIDLYARVVDPSLKRY